MYLKTRYIVNILHFLKHVKYIPITNNNSNNVKKIYFITLLMYWIIIISPKYIYFVASNPIPWTQNYFRHSCIRVVEFFTKGLILPIKMWTLCIIGVRCLCIPVRHFNCSLYTNQKHLNFENPQKLPPTSAKSELRYIIRGQ